MSTTPRSSGCPEFPEPSQLPSSLGFLIFSWLFVGIPLAWGVFQTIHKSMDLFH